MCRGAIRDQWLREFFRREVCDFTRDGLEAISNNLAVRVTAILADRGGVVVFKIGITTDPCFRMFNPAFGYGVVGHLYDRMDLLAASFPEVCIHLERRLISRFNTTQGCQNVAPGGESAPADGLCYVYLVTEPVGDGRPRRWRRPALD